MKRKLFTMICLLVLALLASAGSVVGQEGLEDPAAVPQAPVSVEGSVASKISYQGVLRENGSLVTGTRSMSFTFYGNSGCAVASVAAPTATTAINVPVVNGLFSVAVDVNPAVFDGRGLWLRVQVGGVNLGCQEVLPAPYALSLRPGAIISGGGTVLNLNSTTGTTLQATTSTTAGGAVAAISGSSTATTGGKAGVLGEIASQTDYTIGVWGHATGTSGITTGVWGETESRSDGARGVTGWAKGTSGATVGVRGDSVSPTGTGVLGVAGAGSGETHGVEGWSWSPSGWAGAFTNPVGYGVWISTAKGKEALGVHLGDVVVDEGNLMVGGSKSAVVDTQDGSRLLYTEESTEVWFTDYGFGKLASGVAQVAIDPIFAQTVNLAKPYHVFVQVYGDADVYVTDRTATGFEVRLRGGDPSAEFSYRIVAKRLGFEGQRLELEPSISDHPAIHGAIPVPMVVPVTDEATR